MHTHERGFATLGSNLAFFLLNMKRKSRSERKAAIKYR